MLKDGISVNRVAVFPASTDIPHEMLTDRRLGCLEKVSSKAGFGRLVGEPWFQ
jgi:hypothetical protein